jgi:hypothetical protein
MGIGDFESELDGGRLQAAVAGCKRKSMSEKLEIGCALRFLYIWPEIAARTPK